MKGRKTGGRKKGTPNAVTAEMREFLAGLLMSKSAQRKMKQDLASLSPFDRLTIEVKLLSFVIPKRQHSDTDLTGIPTFADFLMSTGTRKEDDQE